MDLAWSYRFGKTTWSNQVMKIKKEQRRNEKRYQHTWLKWVLPGTTIRGSRNFTRLLNPSEWLCGVKLPLRLCLPGLHSPHIFFCNTTSETIKARLMQFLWNKASQAESSLFKTDLSQILLRGLLLFFFLSGSNCFSRKTFYNFRFFRMDVLRVIREGIGAFIIFHPGRTMTLTNNTFDTIPSCFRSLGKLFRRAHKQP